MNDCFNNINDILIKIWINSIEKIIHPSVFTCEEADKYCPNPEFWLKNLLIKTKKWLFICVLLWNNRLSKDKIKLVLESKFSFITKEEAINILWCELWAIPPFWKFENIWIIIDKKVLNIKELYFNPWVNTITYWINKSDFLKIFDFLKMKLFDISE